MLLVKFQEGLEWQECAAGQVPGRAGMARSLNSISQHQTGGPSAKLLTPVSGKILGKGWRETVQD